MKIQVTNDHAAWPVGGVIAVDEDTAVPPGPGGLFLMRPFAVAVRGEIPTECSEGTPLQWVEVVVALTSPVLQVRMMVAAAL